MRKKYNLLLRAALLHDSISPLFFVGIYLFIIILSCSINYELAHFMSILFMTPKFSVLLEYTKSIRTNDTTRRRERRQTHIKTLR